MKLKIKNANATSSKICRKYIKKEILLHRSAKFP